MEFLLFLPVLLLAVVVHEVAHAWVARREGDRTAERQGRITLNPIPHLDLVGSFLVPAVLFFLPGSFIFGWARPVPVNPGNFRDPKWGDIRVSLAGPVSNFLLAGASVLLVIVCLRLLPVAGALEGVVEGARQAAMFSIFINLILGIFNLIPLPPLDGSHVVSHLLPRPLAVRYRKFGKYGLGALLLLVFLLPESFRILLWPVRILMGTAETFIQLWI